MYKRWNECVDIGDGTGLYWREDGADDYVLAVEVTACSDAGGPLNLYHVQIGSIYIPRDDDMRKSALGMIGGDPASRRDLVEGFRAYHGIDRNREVVIRIGRKQPPESPPFRGEEGWNPAPDVILRSDAHISNYVRRELLD